MAKQRRPRKPALKSRKTTRRTNAEPVTVLKPRKLVPGIEGRSAWFARRAGAHERAQSLERLRTAIDAAENMPDRAAIIEVTFQDALALLSRLGEAVRERVRRTPTLVDIRGSVRDVRVRSQTAPTITALSTPLEVSDGGFLFVPVRARSAEHLDIDDIIVADISDRERLRLNHTFKYWPEERRAERRGLGADRHTGLAGRCVVSFQPTPGHSGQRAQRQ